MKELYYVCTHFSYCTSSKEHALYLSLFLVPNTIVTHPLVENASKLQEKLQFTPH